jgi:hypothetical protein
VTGWLDDPYVTIMLYNVLIAGPLWRIFRRTGLKPLLALLVFVPLVGPFLVLGVLAHSRWPNRPDRPRPEPRKPRRSV